MKTYNLYKDCIESTQNFFAAVGTELHRNPYTRTYNDHTIIRKLAEFLTQENNTHTAKFYRDALHDFNSDLIDIYNELNRIHIKLYGERLDITNNYSIYRLLKISLMRQIIERLLYINGIDYSESDLHKIEMKAISRLEKVKHGANIIGLLSID